MEEKSIKSNASKWNFLFPIAIFLTFVLLAIISFLNVVVFYSASEWVLVQPLRFADVFPYIISGVVLSAVCIVVDIVCKKTRAKSGKKAPCVPIWLSLLPLATVILNYLFDRFVYCWGFYMYVAGDHYFLIVPIAAFTVITLIAVYRKNEKKPKPIKKPKAEKPENIKPDISNMID